MEFGGEGDGTVHETKEPCLVDATQQGGFSRSKTITEQMPAYESLVREYERVSGNTFPEDSMIASILLALPMACRAMGSNEFAADADQDIKR